ncbi:hypothetical protein EYF80_011702 [Liparis tanakae]|uniref:Uncharacterized protein n=1 Tax=Liparis tanakae TaxID=230148 RepID=A0A4Z2IIV4_9TELE|nr:hypothetical protein EYF80_011702 [Liparis tanakae]
MASESQQKKWNLVRVEVVDSEGLESPMSFLCSLSSFFSSGEGVQDTVTVPVTFSSSSTGPGGLGSSSNGIINFSRSLSLYIFFCILLFLLLFLLLLNSGFFCCIIRRLFSLGNCLWLGFSFDFLLYCTFGFFLNFRFGFLLHFRCGPNLRFLSGSRGGGGCCGGGCCGGSLRIGLCLSDQLLSLYLLVELSALPMELSATIVYSPVSLGPTLSMSSEQTPQIITPITSSSTSSCTSSSTSSCSCTSTLSSSCNSICSSTGTAISSISPCPPITGSTYTFAAVSPSAPSTTCSASLSATPGTTCSASASTTTSGCSFLPLPGSCVLGGR